MPTYEYKCNRCDHRFEHVQSMTDPPLITCPQCGAEAVVRLISGGTGLLFKGSGFYITDYRKDSYKADAKKDDAKKEGAKKESPESTKPKTDSSAKPDSSAAPKPAETKPTKPAPPKSD